VKRAILLLGFCVAAVPAALGAGEAQESQAQEPQELQAGLWKVVTKAEANGITAPDQQSMRCLTPDEVSNLEATFSPNSRTTNATCETVEHDKSPQRLKWHLQCKGQIDMDVSGEFHFDAPEHYTATITTRASMLGNEMQRSQASIEAQRVGACP
jgi:uncharacterized protein DUF3617